jgi:hypothetical protein
MSTTKGETLCVTLKTLKHGSVDPLQAKWCADQAENFTEYLENVKKYFIVED